IWTTRTARCRRTTRRKTAPCPGRPRRRKTLESAHRRAPRGALRRENCYTGRMTTLSDSALREIASRLKAANDAVARHYPGEAASRQPVHTVYGGAHLFK